MNILNFSNKGKSYVIYIMLNSKIYIGFIFFCY